MMLLYSGENDIMMDATLSINHTGQAEKYAWPHATQSSIHHNIIFT